MNLFPLSRREKSIVAIVIGISFIIMFLVLYLWQTGDSSDSDWTFPTELDKQGSKAQEIEATALFMVDVKGAVVNPGVYSVKEGDRVIDVIELAGGLQENANKNAINLAQLIHDEMVLYIPKIGEAAQEVVASVQQHKMNINNATVAQLIELKGIGEAKAKAIVSYREKNGKFNTVDDLLKVSGIGEKTLEKFRDDIIAY
jgi:competence protein ComEA